jgi:hypothetical protein
MADEASVRMTVDSSQAMSENQKYTRAAQETFNQLLQKSEQYGNSLKQRAMWLEREIELMKQRNRLETRTDILTEHQMYAAGKITGKERTADIAGIRAADMGKNTEINELVKLTKQWTTDQKIAQQKAERMGDAFTRMLPGFLSADTAGGMAAAGSSGLLAALGVAGVLAGIGIAKEIRGAATMEPAVRDYAALMRSSMLGIKGAVAGTKEMDLGSVGMTPSQYFTNYAQLFRAGGGRVNENMLGIMNAERALGLGRQTTSGLLGVERYGGGQITNIMSFFDRYLQKTSQSIAVLPEILQTFTQEANAMLRNSGKVDAAAIAAAVATVGKSYGLTGEPLQNVFNAMRQGLQQSSNPAIQAMQFSAMERAMPGASLWQMQMAMTNPLENPKYVRNMMDMLRQTSAGGREGYARNLANALNIDPILADKLSRGEYSPELFAKEQAAFKKTGVGGYRGRAEGLTGATEKVAGEVQGMWERTGFNNAQELAESLRKLLDGLTSAYATTAEIISKNNDFAETQIQLAQESKTFLGKMWHYMESGQARQGTGMFPR